MLHTADDADAPLESDPLPALMAAAASIGGERRVERWQRIGLGIRLAYNPDRADVLRSWIALGIQLARARDVDEPLLWRHAFRLLLQTACDEALNWRWRAACLEHTAWPMARLTTLLRTDAQRKALALAVERVEQRLLASAR